MKVDILGTKYTIIYKKYDEDKIFKEKSITGYCNYYTKTIAVCDMSTYKGWEDNPKETCEKYEKETLRHEIIHAFLDESGLRDSSAVYSIGWANNEEMVDWIAIQFPKMLQVFEKVGCV